MKVYYNKSCSICRTEINLYKKQNIKGIKWIDITQNKGAEKETAVDNIDDQKKYLIDQKIEVLKNLNLN